MLHVVKVEVESTEACAIILFSPRNMLIPLLLHQYHTLLLHHCSATPHIEARHSQTVLMNMSIHLQNCTGRAR